MHAAIGDDTEGGPVSSSNASTPSAHASTDAATSRLYCRASDAQWCSTCSPSEATSRWPASGHDAHTLTHAYPSCVLQGWLSPAYMAMVTATLALYMLCTCMEQGVVLTAKVVKQSGSARSHNS